MPTEDLSLSWPSLPYLLVVRLGLKHHGCIRKLSWETFLAKLFLAVSRMDHVVVKKLMGKALVKITSKEYLKSIPNSGF